MTKVLLAHSFFLKNDAKQMEKMKPYPPLGTLYAAAYLRNAGYDVTFFDATFAAGVEDFEIRIEEHQPHFVVLYEDQFHFLNKMCLGHAREAARRMSECARRREATVIAAGADVTDHPEAYFSSGVQYAITGEADHRLVELIDILSGRMAGTVESLAGVAFPALDDPQGVQLNSATAPERHPDRFPFPAWDLIDTDRYRSAWLAAHGYFSINMVSTRGCPFHCNWCAKPIWGQRYAMRSPANVAEELALIKRTLHPDHIWFADDIFGLQPEWVTEFAREVQLRDASIPFMIQSRVDLMTEVAVSGLERAGCAEVWMGVESGSQKILDAMDKGTKLAQVPRAVMRLRNAGIRVCFFLQFGYPGETLEDILATIELVRDNLPDDIGVSVSYPLPGTKLYKMVRAELGDKRHWDESNDMAMMFRGPYRTPFYRTLHQLLHRDLLLRQRLRRGVEGGERLEAELELLGRDWAAWRNSEAEHRNPEPTSIFKYYDAAAAPDLSQRWN